MNHALLIGIDIGTTSVKTVVFDTRGNIISHAGQEYPTAYPHPNWAQQDPNDWWRAACRTLNRMFAENTFEANKIAGIGISCQAPTMVAVDKKGQPLHPALIWMDRRADPQCAWLRENTDEQDISKLNGGRIDPYYLAPKLLWFKENEPVLYRKTYQFLQANGYVAHKLCGTFSFDVSHGPLALFFDSAQLDWSEKLLDNMKLEPDKLPPVMQCTEVIGEVTREAAKATGLIAGTPVVAGMVDGTAAAVEAGTVEIGDAVEMTGQSTVLLICSDHPYQGNDLIPLVHAIPGQYLVGGALVASGGALRWFRDQLGESERLEAEQSKIDVFELLSKKAGQSPPGASRLVFLPYMYGERSPIWDSDARGVFFGLSLSTKREDIIRAIMEGAAFGLRHNIETAADAGIRLSNLACVGGGARSAIWNQIKADILKRPIRLPRTFTGAPLGDAIVTAAGVGIYCNVAEAVKNMVSTEMTYQPNTEVGAVYDSFYDIYRNLYPALKENFKLLSAVPDDKQVSKR